MATCCKKIFKVQTFGFSVALCGATATRVRDEDGYQRHYCANCDPIRKEQASLNSKQRKADKKSRWKQMEKR
jgi:hypothetical protein